MAEERAYIVFDGSNKPLPWPPELHGEPTRIFKQSRSGGWEAFLKAVEDPKAVRGVIIAAPPQSLSIMVGGLKAHYPQTFLDLMKVTLVLLTEDEDTSQVDPLKRLYGFRTLTLSSWTEEHVMEFVGNIFQPPLEQIPEAPRLEGGQMVPTQMVDYYQLLGLQRTANQKEIHAALAYYREYWSDRSRNPDVRAKAEYSLALVGQAETLLLEPAKRERYDAVLETVRNQPRGRGPRGTRRLDAGDDNVYRPTAWTREGGFTQGSSTLEKRVERRDPRDPKDESVYRPPGWSRDDKEPEPEARPDPAPADEAGGDVYRPPSWSREEDEREAAMAEAAAYDDRFEEAPAPDVPPEAAAKIAPARPRVDPADPDAVLLAAAIEDPDLENLPGLGKRREDPGGDPWPPKDWPPKDWVPRDSHLLEDQSGGVPVEEEHGPLATEEAPPLLEEVGPAEDASPDEIPEFTRAIHHQPDSAILHVVPPASPDHQIWASSFLALDVNAAFPAEAGILLGSRFEVGDRHHYVVTGTYSLGGEAPQDQIGYYVRTRPANLAEAAEALDAQTGAVTTVDLALAVDMATGFGRFFKAGASRRPLAASPVVRLSSWQMAPPVGGDRLFEVLRANKWTLLAASGLVFLGLFTWSLYNSLGNPERYGPPRLEPLEASSYIRADGVVIKWKAAYEKIAIYRVDAADSTAHWKLIARFHDRRQSAVDPEPVQTPGRYRYLIVGTAQQPPRTLLSDIQTLDVR